MQSAVLDEPHLGLLFFRVREVTSLTVISEAEQNGLPSIISAKGLLVKGNVS